VGDRSRGRFTTPISLDTMVLRTRGYAYAVGVWDLSIVHGPFSVAPCQTVALRFATFSSLYAPVAAFLRPQAARKLVFAQMLVDAQQGSSSQLPVLIRQRNVAAIASLSQALADDCSKVAVVYGPPLPLPSLSQHCTLSSPVRPNLSCLPLPLPASLSLSRWHMRWDAGRRFAHAGPHGACAGAGVAAGRG
jgi:hypothetical protein